MVSGYIGLILERRVQRKEVLKMKSSCNKVQCKDVKASDLYINRQSRNQSPQILGLLLLLDVLKIYADVFTYQIL